MHSQLPQVALLATLMGLSAPVMASGDLILKFHHMVGVDGAYLGAANPIRGVNGGGLPWVLESAKGKLEEDGELEVRVKGLIIPESAGRGFNPAPFFRALVSCLSVDAGGAPTRVNLLTDNGAEVMIGDPLRGDARIEADLELPEPCVAPLIFVTSPTGAWFAVTGAGSLAP